MYKTTATGKMQATCESRGNAQQRNATWENAPQAGTSACSPAVHHLPRANPPFPILGVLMPHHSSPLLLGE